jgi:hypothetical protein
VSVRETELMETGMIRIQDINFDTGKATIKKESFRVLDDVGGILSRWPQLRIEIGGHTDARGSDALNQKLSEARAKAVRDYLLNKFPELDPGQFTSVGYGERQPIATNTTTLGMAKNRRVEFKVLNKESPAEGEHEAAVRSQGVGSQGSGWERRVRGLFLAGEGSVAFGPKARSGLPPSVSAHGPDATRGSRVVDQERIWGSRSFCQATSRPERRGELPLPRMAGIVCRGRSDAAPFLLGIARSGVTPGPRCTLRVDPLARSVI